MEGFLILVFTNILFALVSYSFFLGNQVLPAANICFATVIAYTGSMGLRLTREEKNRTRLRKAIGSYVSDSVINEIIESGRLPDLGGETRDVTILFSDIRGFTTLSEVLEPKEVVELLNQYYTLVCEPIINNGGMIDKFIGDAVMAVFGAPAPLEDKAYKSLLAAVEMIKIAADFQKWMEKRFSGKNLPLFRIGVGIHTGEAVIGNIGSAKRMGYTAIGDTVNIAARLESLCKTLGWTIVASKKTVDMAGENRIITGSTKKVQPTGRSPPPLDDEEKEAVNAAKETYKALVESSDKDDITPELFLFSFLAEYDRFDDMKSLIKTMRMKQPENKEINRLEKWLNDQI